MKTFDFIDSNILTFLVFKHDLIRLLKRRQSLSVKPVPRFQLGDFWGSRENESIRQMFKKKLYFENRQFKNNFEKN